QRRAREHDRRGLEAVLREDSRGVRAVGGHDQAEVGALLADAGADAGGRESLRQFHGQLHGVSSAARAASRTRSGAVPPIALLAARMVSSVTPCCCAIAARSGRLRLTWSCASRNGTPVAVMASATAVAISASD